MGNNERLVPLDEMHMHAVRVSFISSEESLVCAAWIDLTAEKNIPVLIPFALTRDRPALSTPPLRVISQVKVMLISHLSAEEWQQHWW